VAKKAPGPYDQYDDLQLLLRYLKLCDDMEQHIDIPQWAGVDVPFEKSQALAEKIDKIVLECYLRGLMGNSKLSPEERAEIVKQALVNLKANASNVDLKEGPFGESLTDKAKALRPWADPSLAGKYHGFIHYARQEEIVAATADIAVKYEDLRKKSCDEDNATIKRIRDEKKNTP
jgi:hypothetical protein